MDTYRYCGLAISESGAALCALTDSGPREWTLDQQVDAAEICGCLEEYGKDVRLLIQGPNVGSLCSALQWRGVNALVVKVAAVSQAGPITTTPQDDARRAAESAKQVWPPPWPLSRRKRAIQPFLLLPLILVVFGIERMDDPSRWLRLVESLLTLATASYGLYWGRRNRRVPFMRVLQMFASTTSDEEPGGVRYVPSGRRGVFWFFGSTAIIIICTYFPWKSAGGVLLLCLAWAALLAWLTLRLGREVRQAAVPLVMAISYYASLRLDPLVEILRVVNSSPIYVTILTYFGWTLLIVFFSQILLQLTWRSFHLNPGDQGRLNFEQKVVATLIGSAPFVGAVVATWNSLSFNGSNTNPRVDAVAMCFVGMAIMFRLQEFVLDHQIGNTLTAAVFMSITIFYVGWLGRLLGFSIEPAAILILTGWFAPATFLFYFIGRIGRTVGVPAILFVAIWFAVLSYFDLNDNHELAFARTSRSSPAASDAFNQWLSRTDDGALPHTAFVVVSEGGGARAEYMTAAVLEILRNRCEAFRRLHFATIGVSGGSVGAALSAMSNAPSTKGCDNLAAFESSKNPTLEAAGIDLLGPALRGFLLADLPRWLWPGSLWRTHGDGPPGRVIRSSTDGSQYMEEAVGRKLLEQAQVNFETRLLFSGLLEQDKRHQAVRPQDRLFSSAWDGPKGDKPALILLTTDVATGRRIAATHLRFPACEGQDGDCRASTAGAGDSAGGRLLSFDDVMPGREPTLLGAAFASARFPGISPPATLPSVGTPQRVVDGGYFENSGLTTALELVESMAIGARRHGLCEGCARVVLIRIENGLEKDKAPGTGFVEQLSPLRAFAGTREARAELSRLTVDQAVARGKFGSGCGMNSIGGCVALDQVKLHLKPCDDVSIPLSWSLSERAKDQILTQLGIKPAKTCCAQAIAAQNLKEFSRILAFAKAHERR